MAGDAAGKMSTNHWLHIPAQVIVAGFCFYWYLHSPAPNKAVLILTGVTIVMALLGMHPGHKVVYLLLVICLMSIENRAINQDRAKFETAQTEARKEEKRSFEGLLAQERAGVQTILDQQQKSLAGVLEQEREHSKQMLETLVAEHRREERNFAELLAQERGLFNQQHEIIESENGHLLPGNDPMPPLAALGCEGMLVDDQDYFIVAGNATFIVRRFPFPVLTISGRTMMWLSKIAGRHACADCEPPGLEQCAFGQV